MKDWLLVVWNTKQQAILRKQGMLVLDTFNGHLTPELNATINGSSMNTDLMVITGGMISELQVLHVVVNKSLKDHLKQLYSEWLSAEDHALTPDERNKKSSVTLLCLRIITAQQCISPEVNGKGFKKCCISSATEGAVSNECEEHDSTDCEYGDSDTDW
jgi:hypothetical protein